jgi:integrase
VKKLGVRVGNWLTAEQGRKLLAASQGESLRNKRDYAALALLLGCGLRLAELVALRMGDIQQREDRWIIADLVGKGRHIRSVPVPDWVKKAIDAWTQSADIKNGPLLRPINKAGRIGGRRV